MADRFLVVRTRAVSLALPDGYSQSPIPPEPARVWTTLATGTIVAKDTAADWALARLAPEHRAVLRFARDLYRTTSYGDETWNTNLEAQAGPRPSRSSPRSADCSKRSASGTSRHGPPDATP